MDGVVEAGFAVVTSRCSLELLHNGASLAEDDDGGDGLNARIVELLQPGTYTIRARSLYSYGGSQGSYRISINRR